MKNFITSLFFIFVMMLLVIGYALIITSSAIAVSVSYVFRWYGLVLGLTDYISDCLENLNEMVYSLREEAEGILSKNKNCENSDI